MARMRTFLAIDLGEEIRDRLVTLQEQFAVEAPDVKWVEPENLHVTLLFLGEVQQREVLAVCRAAQKAIAQMPAFSIEVEGVGAFPNPRRPRTIWVGVGKGAPELVAVHDAIEAPLFEMGNYRRETRAYTPHVTLGRLRGERTNDDLAKAIQKHQTWNAGEVTVVEVAVMTSELTSNGPIYTVMGRAKLA
jgi:RNA 2',3'-cyclic 3'-phosphodiesterase